MTKAEEGALESGYDAQLKTLIATLFANYVSARGDTAKEQQADKAFSNGLAVSRRVYAKAQMLLNVSA